MSYITSSGSNPDHIGWTSCRHRKISYTAKEHARRAIRRLPNHTGMNAYRCVDNPEWWHIGHIPQPKHKRKKAK